MAYLVLTDGEGQGRKFDLKSAGATRIGRRGENDVTLECASVSGTHAEIIQNGITFELRDLGSTNGTRVNGKRVQDARLHRNDIIRFGDISVMIDGDDVPPAPEPSTHESEAASPIPRTTVMMRPQVTEKTRVVPPADFKPARSMHKFWPFLLGVIVLAVIVAFVLYVLADRS